MTEWWLVEHLTGSHTGTQDIIKVRKNRTNGDLEYYGYGNIGWWPFEWDVEFKAIEKMHMVTE